MTTTELAPPERAAFAFGELAIPREFTILQQGREYILSAGLLVGLVQLSRGYYDIETVIVQLPTAENAQTAVVTARVSIFDPDSGRVLRQAGGIGDANPANVGRMVAPHVLRHLLGVGLTALEELDQGGAEPGAEVRNPTPAPRAPSGPSWGQPAPASAPTPVAGAAEHILIAGKPYSRAEVLAIYAKRRDEAKAAGLAMGEVEGIAPEHAPLSTLVSKSQEWKRRMEAKASAAASAK
jgi:hypothetical protein